jgi:Fe-S-cluster containining protein
MQLVDGHSFECIQCGKCCRWAGEVLVEDEDADRISKHQGMDIDKFHNEYCVKKGNKYYLRNQKSSPDCVYLKDNSCTIYELKPKQCTDYPKTYDERCPGFHKLRGKIMSRFEEKVAEMNKKFSGLQAYEIEVAANLFKELQGNEKTATSVVNSVLEEGIDSFFNTDRIKVSSLEDLFAFNRVDSGILIHKSTRDLWTIEKNSNGDVHITRLFNDGEPVKG